MIALLLNLLLGQGSATRIQLDGHEARLRVRVAPRDIGRRNHDEAPAELRIDQAMLPPGRAIDLPTLYVKRAAAAGDQPDQPPLPLRWYDDAIPYNFPECEQNLHATDGVNLTIVARPRWGDIYNVLGDGLSGRLVWLHRQIGDGPADYVVGFKLLPPHEMPRACAARELVGDGATRCAPIGNSTTGMIHARVGTADWNADGLVDLLVGGAKGQVLLYLNGGTRQLPKFDFPRLLCTADGRPVDTGWSAAPLAVDWNHDGLLDLLCGCERNRVLYFQNEGARGQPRLVNKGFLRVAGLPLELPVAPVPNAPQGVYTLDYYPVLEAADWNGDGQTDLLAGGYITGRIYLYETIGFDAAGLPLLADRGPLLEAGRPLNVKDWAAAPCAFDFDSDGDLDLISGNMPVTASGGDSVDAGHFLRYYQNVGTARAPELRERPFPKRGPFPAAALGTPRAADFNDDGLPDLAVSANGNVYLWMNVGRRNAPQFDVKSAALAGRWASAPLPTWNVQFLDWDGDGLRDMLSGLTLFKSQKEGAFTHHEILPPGNRIEHPAPTGDQWTFTQFVDLNNDGTLDLLFGTHEGHVWLHRGQQGLPLRFDQSGERLETEPGTPIKVGPVAGQQVDFDVLQGARTALAAADFDGDGALDLVIADTYGKLRYYRNRGPRDRPRFAAPAELCDQKIRSVPVAVDWNADGAIDLLAAAANGQVVLIRNLGSGRFAPPEPFNLPQVPYSPSVAAVDWNSDGDIDLIVGTAYGYFCWFERSFLENGYAPAAVQP
jgi:hypothetical protein